MHRHSLHRELASEVVAQAVPCEILDSSLVQHPHESLRRILPPRAVLGGKYVSAAIAAAELTPLRKRAERRVVQRHDRLAPRFHNLSAQPQSPRREIHVAPAQPQQRPLPNPGVQAQNNRGPQIIPPAPRLACRELRHQPRPLALLQKPRHDLRIRLRELRQLHRRAAEPLLRAPRKQRLQSRDTPVDSRALQPPRLSVAPRGDGLRVHLVCRNLHKLRKKPQRPHSHSPALLMSAHPRLVHIYKRAQRRPIRARRLLRFRRVYIIKIQPREILLRRAPRRRKLRIRRGRYLHIAKPALRRRRAVTEIPRLPPRHLHAQKKPPHKRIPQVIPPLARSGRVAQSLRKIDQSHMILPPHSV